MSQPDIDQCVGREDIFHRICESCDYSGAKHSLVTVYDALILICGALLSYSTPVGTVTETVIVIIIEASENVLHSQSPGVPKYVNKP